MSDINSTASDTTGDSGDAGIGEEFSIINNIVCCSFSSLSIVSCLVLLGLAAYVYCHAGARHHLDRISFRLVLWSAVLEVIYSAAWLGGSADPVASVYLDGPGCSAFMYFLIATSEAVNWLNACIAINLMLAICFLINPTQLKLERYYVIGSLIFGFLIPIIPAALGQFASDPIYDSCYFREGDYWPRIRDLILDFHLWQLLTCVIATGAVIAASIHYNPSPTKIIRIRLTSQTLATLFRHGRATSRALFVDTPLHNDEETASESTSSCKFRLFCRSRKTSQSATASVPGVDLGHLQSKFLRIALKVALYPLFLMICNVIISLSDLWFSNHAVDNPWEAAFLVLSSVALCIRGFVFAVVSAHVLLFEALTSILGIFVDPCILRGLKEVRKIRRERKVDRQISNDSSSSESPTTEAVRPSMASNREQTFFDFLSTDPGTKEIAHLQNSYNSRRSVVPDPLETGIIDDLELGLSTTTYINRRRSLPISPLGLDILPELASLPPSPRDESADITSKNEQPLEREKTSETEDAESLAPIAPITPFSARPSMPTSMLYESRRASSAVRYSGPVNNGRDVRRRESLAQKRFEEIEARL